MTCIKGSGPLSKKCFYIKTSDLSQAKLECKASTFARKLLAAVFTDDALLACSVSGGLYKAGGKANITSRPALDSDAISLILGELLSSLFYGWFEWCPPPILSFAFMILLMDGTTLFSQLTYNLCQFTKLCHLFYRCSSQ